MGKENGSAVKPTIRVDVTSDTVCPWCYVGKKNIDLAAEEVKDKYNVEVHWHPYQLNPNAPKEGLNKLQYYKDKFGPSRTDAMYQRLHSIFEQLGVDYKMGGLTGNTLDSHRMLELAARQGVEKQNELAEELFKNYFSEEKYIGDRAVLLAAADKVGIEGAKEFLEDTDAGLPEVRAALDSYARGVQGVPHFRIGKQQLSGAQPPEALVAALENAAGA